jgi:diacylglycerol kinase family enzyme
MRRTLGEEGFVVETAHPSEVGPAIERAQGERASVVAVCGGDGTGLHTLSALVRRYPQGQLPTLALLRGGTINTVAKNLGVRGRPDELLKRLVERVRLGELSVCGQDLLRVNGRHGFLFAAAMGARFLEAYDAGPLKGAWWAAALATRTALSCFHAGAYAARLFRPVALELELDGEPAPAPEPLRLVVASTVPDVGVGMKVAWQAGRQPNRFHLVASALPLSQMARQLGRVLRGEPLEGAPHIDRLARSACLRFRVPELVTVDGELFHEVKVELEVGPRVWIARL